MMTQGALSQVFGRGLAVARTKAVGGPIRRETPSGRRHWMRKSTLGLKNPLRTFHGSLSLFIFIKRVKPMGGKWNCVAQMGD